MQNALKSVLFIVKLRGIVYYEYHTLKHGLGLTVSTATAITTTAATASAAATSALFTRLCLVDS